MINSNEIFILIGVFGLGFFLKDGINAAQKTNGEVVIMSEENSIPKAIENFVLKGGISKDETHVDFIDGAVVTWSLSDEQELATTPTLFSRRISDVRTLLRTRKNLVAVREQLDYYTKCFLEEERENTALKIEVENLGRLVEALRTPNTLPKAN